MKISEVITFLLESYQRIVITSKSLNKNLNLNHISNYKIIIIELTISVNSERKVTFDFKQYNSQILSYDIDSELDGQKRVEEIDLIFSQNYYNRQNRYFLFEGEQILCLNIFMKESSVYEASIKLFNLRFIYKKLSDRKTMNYEIIVDILQVMQVELNLDDVTKIEDLIEFLFVYYEHLFQNIKQETIIVRSQKLQKYLVKSLTLSEILGADTSDKFFIEIHKQAANDQIQQQMFDLKRNNQPPIQQKQCQELKIQIKYGLNSFIIAVESDTTFEELISFLKGELNIMEDVGIVYNNQFIQNKKQKLSDVQIKNNSTIYLRPEVQINSTNATLPLISNLFPNPQFRSQNQFAQSNPQFRSQNPFAQSNPQFRSQNPFAQSNTEKPKLSQQFFQTLIQLNQQPLQSFYSNFQQQANNNVQPQQQQQYTQRLQEIDFTMFDGHTQITAKVKWA